MVFDAFWPSCWGSGTRLASGERFLVHALFVLAPKLKFSDLRVLVTGMRWGVRIMMIRMRHRREKEIEVLQIVQKDILAVGAWLAQALVGRLTRPRRWRVLEIVFILQYYSSCWVQC